MCILKTLQSCAWRTIEQFICSTSILNWIATLYFPLNTWTDWLSFSWKKFITHSSQSYTFHGSGNPYNLWRNVLFHTFLSFIATPFTKITRKTKWEKSINPDPQRIFFFFSGEAFSKFLFQSIKIEFFILSQKILPKKQKHTLPCSIFPCHHFLLHFLLLSCGMCCMTIASHLLEFEILFCFHEKSYSKVFLQVEKYSIVGIGKTR